MIDAKLDQLDPQLYILESDIKEIEYDPRRNRTSDLPLRRQTILCLLESIFVQKTL
jgi:hypothetical protein